MNPITLLAFLEKLLLAERAIGFAINSAQTIWQIFSQTGALTDEQRKAYADLMEERFKSPEWQPESPVKPENN